MNLNHDVHSSPKEENYLNGSIEDFTDCLDFTKQYQKSCGFEENNFDGVNETDDGTNENPETVKSDEVKSNSSEKDARTENGKNVEHHPMEPDVFITVGETNLEKNVNHVAATGSQEKSGESEPKVKKNHLKLPLGKNIKKKSSFKLKNGKHVKKKNKQLQGIQSNIKFKCYKCSYSDFSTISELQAHQRNCISGTPEYQPVNYSPSNFRITRKVYLCSACGSYYESWNLFLHMKEVHKRHICLYCLGMFSQPEKLAQHLQGKHNVIEQNFTSSEEFLKQYRGACYLVCVTCEAMFSEQEDFYEHSCVTETDESGPCPLCGLQGAHFPTCRRAYSDRYVEPDPEKSHPAKVKQYGKRKKGGKKKDVFRIVNNDHNGEMSVIVRKQDEGDECRDEGGTSPLRNAEDSKYNEKMLQLYKSSKIQEKVISSIQSIEDSINRVVENSRISDEEKEEDEPEPEPVEEKEPEPVSEATNNPEKEPEISRVENQSDSESTDSEKLTIAFDQPPTEVEEPAQKSEDNIPTASKDTPYIHAPVKEEEENVKALIREFVKVSSWNCVYCSHSKRIAVNGKQLAFHILAEHRFVTVPEGAKDEEKEESALSIIQKLKSSLSSLSNCYFNTDTFDSEDKDFWKPNDRIYECFHCLFATYVHKELYSHNRKMHQKAVFLCIMCKSNFYNYSELLCHLCPGIYISGQVINPDITYRCFLCNVDPLPSSFRLMVHLRRRHNSCDICFDLSANQFQLSTHVWKHKLSHMCYRCGIAYRNKPDITKHLFWKHGTESVLCKKCLQKKWPHVYHFCVPPNSFICDECSVSLKSAVALKVHKRLHSGDYPYPCSKCEEKFISRKILAKHLLKHEEEENRPPEPPGTPENESIKNTSPVAEEVKNDTNVSTSDAEKKPEKEKKPKKRKVLTDVFDLPPVNLSESDDSDQEDEKPKVCKPESPVEEMPNGFLNGDVQKEEPSPTQVVDGVWNNFQNYLVAKDMPKTFRPGSPFKNMTLNRIKEIMLSDHDYHIIPNSTTAQETAKSEGEKEDKKAGLDHDYCNNVPKQKGSHKAKQKTKHREDMSKSSSSDSSSDSDSSCSCGSNCSCISGSSSSTSSNDSDSDSREKRKQKQKKTSREEKITNEAEPEAPTEVDISVHDVSNDNMIRESDLETDETETDEDFYDYNPAREANRILAEKRTQLLANLNGSEAVASSPSAVTEKPESPKKKSKLKKKRSQYRANASRAKGRKNPPLVNRVPPPEVTPDPVPKTIYETPTQVFNRVRVDDAFQSSGDGDSKRPKRKRVPLKFYGFSSDDESEAASAPRKREKSEHNTTTPASTSNTPTLDLVDTPQMIWNPNSKTSLSWRVEKGDTSTPKVNPIKIKTSQALRPHPPLEGSDLFAAKRPERNFQVNGNTGGGQKGEKLYCFCQCPYDEVSEMIACDAEDCVIEWFHFECVGIMVPPKGSWYCPDCRKKLAAENEFLLPSASEPNVNV